MLRSRVGDYYVKTLHQRNAIYGRMDHDALRWLMRLTEFWELRRRRWRLRLAYFQFIIEYWPEGIHQITDALLRLLSSNKPTESVNDEIPCLDDPVLLPHANSKATVILDELYDSLKLCDPPFHASAAVITLLVTTLTQRKVNSAGNKNVKNESRTDVQPLLDIDSVTDDESNKFNDDAWNDTDEVDPLDI